jgi:hypothetical protein
LLLAAAALGLQGISATAAEETAQVTVGRSRLDISFSEPIPHGLREAALNWITDCGKAVTAYLSRFPVERVKIRVRVRDGQGAKGGTTYGWNGALITLSMGRGSTAESFADDWLLTHEMLHLGFPSVPEQHHWIEEGISTYVEPIARCRAGLKRPEALWKELIDGLPQGLPKAGDRGLDHTPTWGRTYWGGAIFCLLADVRIRERTGNRFGLEHALRAILAAGGTIESDWPLARAIRIGDGATGVPVLSELYEEMKEQPAPVDLDGLWRRLGVTVRGGKITFDEDAPLAAVRRAITSGR